MLVKQNSAKNRWRDKAETVEKKIEMNRVSVGSVLGYLAPNRGRWKDFDSLSLSLPPFCSLPFRVTSKFRFRRGPPGILTRPIFRVGGAERTLVRLMSTRGRACNRRVKDGMMDPASREQRWRRRSVEGVESLERVYAISGLIWPIKKSRETRAQVRWILESVDGIR